VQIIATGFAGLRFLRQSHRQMTEDYINVYGGYAIKLLRLQNEMIQTFDRHQPRPVEGDDGDRALPPDGTALVRAISACASPLASRRAAGREAIGHSNSSAMLGRNGPRVSVSSVGTNVAPNALLAIDRVERELRAALFAL
jgi:hypothetical protein